MLVDTGWPRVVPIRAQLLIATKDHARPTFISMVLAGSFQELDCRIHAVCLRAFRTSSRVSCCKSKSWPDYHDSDYSMAKHFM